ncbi:tRNA lysidine(34) synthetase TilS [Sphingomonas sp.]|uniref:tRNA lysidine(34) synthetase TilS n=1 Tax=Sphingomonas sp. TaxID=28214 RepID=UPI00286E983E|nr:tRNA lysidine(34) synthetase TilS [Sphingomonas sp.]
MAEPAGTVANRFAADLDGLIDRGARLGVAVSGGPDSLALLLLATAARPGAVEAATVDHGLRPAARAEAEQVGAICGQLGVPHRTLAIDWSDPPAANLQARARAARYAALGEWAQERALAAVATAHHLDDQAETLLMRLARGSGVGGLAGVQAKRQLCEGVMLVRPLLGWRRAELGEIVAAARLEPVDDPSNRDDRFDRTRVRALLADTEWLDPTRLAAAAGHLRDAEQALEWAASRELAQRRSIEGETLVLDPAGLPRDLRRRLLLAGIAALGGEEPPGPKLTAALDALDAGATTTLAGLKLVGGAAWRLSPAPPRRKT